MAELQGVKEIRSRIQKRMKTNPHVRFSTNMPQTRLKLERVEGVLVGAYTHIFQVDEQSTGRKLRHTLQYTDLISGHVKIEDLD